MRRGGRVFLSEGAGRGVARIGKELLTGVGQLIIERGKGGLVDVDLTANLDKTR